jgi:hypothetical protein
MAEQHTLLNGTQAGSRGGAKGRRPEGHRWLSVSLPQETFNQLHIQARLSNLSFQQYMIRFCEEAFPLPGSSRQKGTLPEQAQALT